MSVSVVGKIVLVNLTSFILCTNCARLKKKILALLSHTQHNFPFMKQTESTYTYIYLFYYEKEKDFFPFIRLDFECTSL